MGGSSMSANIRISDEVKSLLNGDSEIVFALSKRIADATAQALDLDELPCSLEVSYDPESCEKTFILFTDPVANVPDEIVDRALRNTLKANAAALNSLDRQRDIPLIAISRT